MERVIDMNNRMSFRVSGDSRGGLILKSQTDEVDKPEQSAAPAAPYDEIHAPAPDGQCDRVRREHSAAAHSAVSSAVRLSGGTAYGTTAAVLRPRRQMEGSLRRHWDAAFRALAMSLGMGAVLLAIVHALSHFTPVSPASAESVGVAGGANRMATSDAVLIDLAVAEKRLVIPPVRLPVLEAGVYFTRAGADGAAASFADSGVQTVISGTGPYTLLIAPYGSRGQVARTEQLLRNAEVPFFVRWWGTGGQAPLLPASLRVRAGAVERWFFANEQLLWWLVNGGHNASVGRELRAAAATARAKAGVSVLDGSFGRRVADFSTAVDDAWRQRGTSLAEEAAQTRALVALASLE